MNIQLMDIKRQHNSYAQEYEQAIIDVLRSGQYIGGKEVEAFEEEFAAYYGAQYGVSCGNGTDALVLALRALGIGVGDEVITVSWTFFATAESIAAVGATPVFVDTDRDTYCIDVNKIEQQITARTKAILPVHFYGQSCDMDEITKLCKKHNLYLIVDCAQCAGTRYKGERSRVLGDVSCFSFFPTKNLGCAGDGGMILTDNSDIARIAKSLKLHGSGKDGYFALQKEYSRCGKNIDGSIPMGESKYYNYVVGYNSRLDAIQATLLRKKLTHLDEFVELRRENAKYYNKCLANTAYGIPYEPEYSFHSYYIYALKHPKAVEIMRMLKEKGIACGTYYPVPLHLQGVFAHLGYRDGDLPVTEELSRTSFAIPVFPELNDMEREYIVDELLKASESLNEG